MATSNHPRATRTPDAKTRVTRRQLLTHGAALGAAGALMAGCRGTRVAPDPLSEEILIGASGLSGERLSQERVRALKPVLEFNLKHLQVLREFDPDEEEPLTMFHL